MKTFAAGLAADYASGCSTLCTCMKVTRTDGVVEGYTTVDVDVVVDGVTYQTIAGLDASNIVAASGLSVANLDATVLPDEDAYPKADVLAGLMDGAEFLVFECNYLDPTRGINILQRGTIGEADQLRSSNKFEFRSLVQALQQNIGASTQLDCRYRLGSTAYPDGLCKVDLTPYTHIHVVTSVASRRQFTCSGAAEADDYYGEGEVTALDGANLKPGGMGGYRQKVKDFAAGVFTLALPMPFAITVGDTFQCVAGCRKRHKRTAANPGGVSDCIDKFSNVLNFGGEPHIPGADLLTADPDVGAS